MGSLDSLERGRKVWEGLVEASRQSLKDFKTKHPMTWWLRPAYWKMDKAHHKLFLQLINYRIKYATALKESNNG
jgi:hypothetical protein